MNRTICSALVFVAVLFLTCVAQAQVAEIPYLSQGRPAPFEGFLVRGPDLANWKSRIELLEHQLTLDVSTEQRIAEIRVSLEQARTQAAEARLVLRERLWREQATTLSRDLAEARKNATRSWWENSTLWFSLGVILTTALSVTLTVL